MYFLRFIDACAGALMGLGCLCVKQSRPFRNLRFAKTTYVCPSILSGSLIYPASFTIKSKALMKLKANALLS